MAEGIKRDCEDLFEDDGLGGPGVKLKLTIKIRGDSLTADFTGSGGSKRHQRHLLVSQRAKDRSRNFIAAIAHDPASWL